MSGHQGVVDMALLSVIVPRDRMGRDAADDDVDDDESPVGKSCR
jgi:hypothetical protein